MRLSALLGLFLVFAAFLASSSTDELELQPLVGMPSLEIDADE